MKNLNFIALRSGMLLLGLFVLVAGRIRGAVLVVTDTNDSLKITSLRGAVAAANRNGKHNTILLGMPNGSHPNQWIYRLTIPGANENAGRAGDLDITSGNLTIIGVTTNVTIDATGLGDRVFQVFPTAHLTLSHLTITGGAAPDAQPGSFYAPTLGAENGGAIYNAGVLDLQDCIITNNSSGNGNYNPGNGGGSDGADGGGIYNAGTLRAVGCSLVGNYSGAGVGGAMGGNGGGIRNDGRCFFTNCIIGGNQAGNGGSDGSVIGFGGIGGNGGGIFNLGTMILNGCIVAANTAGSGTDGGDPSGIVSVLTPGGWGGNGGSGGGIYNGGQMQLDFSTVSENAGGDGGNGGSFGSGGNAGSGGGGGGILNAGNLTLNTSTISDNLCGNGGFGGSGAFGANGGAGGEGGGLYNGGSFAITSCTFTLNQTGAGGYGGNGFDFIPTVPLNQKTPADNTANGESLYNPPAVGGPGGNGGGIFNAASSTNAVIRNTMIAQNLVNVGGMGGTNTDIGNEIQSIGNAGENGSGFDVAGNFVSQGFNLIGMADGSVGFINGNNADQTGSDANPINPLLGPLQMNGGFTPTHALLFGSPAINQGKCFGVRLDQRGQIRPYQYPLIPDAPGGDGSDIGAFELGAR
jgi:hypothetical protein